MAYIQVDPHSAVPLYEQILEQVRDSVRRRALSPGDLLPSVRQLAADLGINPNTVAKAYLLLERDGIIKTVRRRGTFIADDATGRITASTDRRLTETVERFLEEASRLGIDRERILEEMRRRVRPQDPSEGGLP